MQKAFVISPRCWRLDPARQQSGGDGARVKLHHFETVPDDAYFSFIAAIDEEDDWQDPTKKRVRVSGYVEVDRAGGGSSDVPSSGAPSHDPAPAQGGDIPF